jgi:uncharacterized membrane protein
MLPTGGPVVFRDFNVSEDGQAYRLSDSQEPGSFRIIDRQGAVEVRWFFRAGNESRTFDFQYRALYAVKNHEDASVLYFQFVSNDWDRWQKNVRLRLKPPRPLPKGEVNEWLHGPLWAASKIEDDGTIVAWCQHLPGKTYFEIRALYPTDAFPGARTTFGFVRERITEEEAGWAEEANRQREIAIQKEQTRQERWAMGKWIVFGVGLVGLMGWWELYKRFGRRSSLPPPVRIMSDIPENIPPALVGYLMNGRQIYGGALMGTLFDLARRKFITLRQVDEEKKGLFGGSRTKTTYHWDLDRAHWGKNASDLTEHEDGLIRFIFDELAEGQNSIDLKSIQKERSKFIKFFNEWKKDVKKAAEQRDWFDKQSYKGMWYSLAVAGIMLLLTLPAGFYFGPWSLVLAGFTAFVIVLSLLIPHRTRDGEMLARHWKALKRYLKKYHYRSDDRSVLLNRIDDYLIYGVVLGLEKKVFKELAGLIPADNYPQYIPWYVYHGGRAGVFTPDAFATAFSSMVATTTSAMSTAAGVGGGASAGGGGGAGSGGGGAG